MSGLQVLRRVVRHEAKLLAAERSLWVVVLLLAALAAYALFNGQQATRQREALLDQLAHQQAERLPRMLAQLQRVRAGQELPDPFANPADPAAVGSGGAGRHAWMPYAPLAPLAIGQSDMLPNYYRISYRAKSNFMDEGELENPWNLLTGRFDLAFVVVVLMPLLVLALSYNLLSGEREQGTLKLLLAQGLQPHTLLAAKVALRFAVVAGTVSVLACAWMLWTRPVLEWPAALQLLNVVALVCAYVLFWLALAVWVNALGRGSAFNALALIGVWVALVLVLPVLMNLAVQTLSPAPSRTEFATRNRLVTIEGLNRYQALLSADYRYVADPESLRPGPDGRFAVQPRRQAHYLMARDVDAQLDALRDEFDRQLEGQQAWVARLGWLSPAVTTAEGMSASAGTDAARYLHLRRQVDRFHREWKSFFEPRVLGGMAMTEADYARLPRFAWQEVPAAQRGKQALAGLLALLAPTALLFVLAGRQLQRREGHAP